jgi:prolyl oligopeptidase
MLVVYYLQDASDKVEIFELAVAAKKLNDVTLPDIGTIVSSYGKHDSTEFMFKFTSFSDPGSIHRINMESGKFEAEQLSQTKLSDKSIDFNDFVTDQIKYESKDGTMVPMFIVRKKSTLASLDKAPESPKLTLLYGYGGFNISITPSFSPSQLVFLNYLGGIFCVANIRGGGEYGEEWHDAGTKDKKQNVFDDFISAGEYLINKGITSKEKLVIQGGSNGGTLTSACANQRPDLFAGVVCQVPVTDMLRFHKFTIGHFWCSDFGSSEKDGGIDYLLKYSPYHNVKEQKYPAMLVLTADHDDRVVPLHTFKYVAELQHKAGQGNIEGQRPLLTRIEVNAGHGAGKPTEKIIQEKVDSWSFVARVTNTKFIK